MSKRISMKEGAELIGVHVKTLEKYCKDPDFAGATGYHRNPINGRATFDENFFRTYAASVTGNDDLRATNGPEPGVIDAEDLTEAPAKPDALAVVNSEKPDGLVMLEMAFTAIARKQAEVSIIPHKLWLSLKEAKALTGFPESQLRTISELKFGRRVISRKQLEKI
jgi:hypothetical protein